MENLKVKIEKIFDANSIPETSSTGTTGEYIIYAPFNEMIHEIVESIEKPESFDEVVRPLIKYLAGKHHPHTTIIVTSTGAELVEGVQSTGKILDYLID